MAEARARYRAQPAQTGRTPAQRPAFKGSRRYYRGRIVQALRELAPGASLAPDELLGQVGRDGLNESKLLELVEALRRDGLVRVARSGRLRLP